MQLHTQKNIPICVMNTKIYMYKKYIFGEKYISLAIKETIKISE